MASSITNYKCPACTGPMHFDTASGKVVCDYCGSSYEIAEIEALYAEANEAAAAAGKAEEEKAEAAQGSSEVDFSGLSSDWGKDAGKMKCYSCPSCGAELICDDTTAATSCPYCGNPTIVPGQFSGALKPDYVIPFAVDKKTAKEILKSHMSGKKLLPKLFSEESTLDEVKGIYIPFWLFDVDSSARMTYEGNTIRVWSDTRFKYTETSVFQLERAGEMTFEKIPVDGAKKLDNTLLESIEPFDNQKLVPFQSAYLTGFMADRYDVPAEDTKQRIKERVDQTVSSEFQKTTSKYVNVTPKVQRINNRFKKASYAFYPVWLMTVKWNGNTYQFAINGQTGKIAGDLPADESLVRKYHIRYGLIIAAVIYAIMWILALL